MKPTFLFALALVSHAACTTEDLAEEAQDETVDSATDSETMDGYTGRTFDAASLPARLVTGDLVRHGGAAALVPAAGESVYAETVRVNAPSDELSVDVDDDGTVHVATANDTDTSALIDTAAKAAGPCQDEHHNVGNFTWDHTLEYTFKASSTPDDLPVDFAEEAIRQGGRNIVDANNSCGRADHVSATIHYNGRSSRGVNVTHTDICGKRDGHSVVAFGDFDDPTIMGATCVWKRKQYVPGAQATFHYGVESDIRLQKNSETYWQGEPECFEFGIRYVDLEEIVTHELGHSFGLQHVKYSPTLTMYPSINYCQRSKRTLGLGDMLGLEILY